MKPPRVLVGYVTRAGYVRDVAEAIARRLQARGLETDVADLELAIRQPRKYDAVVLGCGARFGHHPTAIASFIAQHRARLGQRPTAFFSVERDAATPDAMTKLFERTQWRPTWTLALPGVQGARLRRLRAWVQDRLDKRVSRVKAPTDWARIESFADQIATEIIALRTASSPRSVRATATDPSEPTRDVIDDHATHAWIRGSRARDAGTHTERRGTRDAAGARHEVPRDHIRCGFSRYRVR